jgi:hypothetical protein
VGGGVCVRKMVAFITPPPPIPQSEQGGGGGAEISARAKLLTQSSLWKSRQEER